MKLTVEKLKQMISEELERLGEETTGNKLRRLLKDEGIPRNYFPFNFSRGSAYQSALMLLKPLIDNKEAIVSDEINRIQGSYTIYVDPRVKDQAKETIEENDPNAAMDMHVPYRVVEE